MHLKVASKEDFDHPNNDNISSGIYANFPVMIIIHCTNIHMLKYHTVSHRCNYYISITNLK